MAVLHLLSFPKIVWKSLRARARIAAVTPGVASPTVMELVGSCDSNEVTSPLNVLGTTDPYPKAKVQGKTAIATQCTLAQEGDVKFPTVVPKVSVFFANGHQRSQFSRLPDL